MPNSPLRIVNAISAVLYHSNLPLTDRSGHCRITVSSENRFAVITNLADFVWLHRGNQWEFNGRRVDNTNDISASWGLDNGREGAVHTIFSVNLNNLLLVIGSLQEFDKSIQRTSIGLQDEFHTVNKGIKGVCAKGSSLNRSQVVSLRHGTSINRQDLSVHGEFHLPNVSNSDGVGSTRGFDNGVEGTLATVFNVHTHFHGGVIGSLPQFDISIQGTSFGFQFDLDTFDAGIQESPGLEGVTLDLDNSSGLGSARRSSRGPGRLHTATGAGHLSLLDADAGAGILNKRVQRGGGGTAGRRSDESIGCGGESQESSGSDLHGD
mmetsp:Transcript_3203/g.6582  ORF Transcript_3203/g.6582 Transcript_3203/m.6582 type:complete len:322 (-) Transcript_3203:320-1285(-)